MAAVDVVKIHPAVSLAVIAAILAAGGIASFVRARREASRVRPPAGAAEGPAPT
jgi:hypothetical protein